MEDVQCASRLSNAHVDVALDDCRLGTPHADGLASCYATCRSSNAGGDAETDNAETSPGLCTSQSLQRPRVGPAAVSVRHLPAHTMVMVMVMVMARMASLCTELSAPNSVHIHN